MVSSLTSNTAVPPPVLSDRYQKSAPLAAFLAEVGEKLDSQISGEARFRPLWKAILRDTEVLEWREEGENYRLRINGPVEAALPDGSGKTYMFEKEIVMQFIPEKLQIVFPKVLEYKESGKKIDPANKELNAIWASERHLGSLYTGVGYSLKWDPETEQFISDNINDAGWLLQSIATPVKKSFDRTLSDWNCRSRAVC